MPYKKIVLLALCLLLVCPAAYAGEYRVVAVSDGDTITVEPIQGGDRAKVRLHGIDAPELRQPYGQAAKTFVINTVLYKDVDIRPTPQGTDRYGRIVAIVNVPNYRILQELLLEEGLAWIYPAYCKDCSSWDAMQIEARRLRKGLWADESPVEPWEWRRQK